MRTYTATITSKGQLTLPVGLRELWKLKSGDQVEFFQDHEGQLRVRPLNAHSTAFLETLPSRKRCRGVKSDDDAIARAVGERNRRSRSVSAAE